MSPVDGSCGNAFAGAESFEILQLATGHGAVLCGGSGASHWKDSYAEAFGDRSARGVIAVAVYRERQEQLRSLKREAPATAERSAGSPAHSDAQGELAKSQPGTGFGEEIYSPVRVVDFDSERKAAAEYFIKYEWRESLCRKGVIHCEPRERNRFWNEDDATFGFAPYPKRR